MPRTRFAIFATRQIARLLMRSRTPKPMSASRSTTHAGRWDGSKLRPFRRLAIARSSACYKLAACIEVEEAYSSQTCPVCGERSQQRRIYRCPKCGYEAARDVVGCLNIRTIGIEGGMRPGCCVPNAMQFVHPSKYPGPSPSSPGDTGQVARKQFREATGL